MMSGYLSRLFHSLMQGSMNQDGQTDATGNDGLDFL